MNSNSTVIPHQRGFTIVEIMVTLAIAAVLLGIGLPAFNGFVAQRALTAQVNDFLVAVQYARSEAVRRRATVSTQAVNAADAGNEWGAGWCVVAGNGGACPNDTTKLREFPALGANTLNGIGGFDGVSTLTFNAQGLLIAPAGAAAGTFQLCNPNEHIGREVLLNTIGRVSSQQPPVADLDCSP